MPSEPADAPARNAPKTTVTPRVLLFYDYSCPFCYVDQFRFDRLASEVGDIEFVLVPFELRPSMPEEGLRVSELQASGSSERVEEHLMRIAAKEGIPLTIPSFLPNTHKAMALVEVGRDAGSAQQWAMHRAVFAAYFASGRDIGDPDVLLDLAQSHGLDRAHVQSAWAGAIYDERIAQFRNVAKHIGITATPAALICNELVIGSRPYEVLKDALDRCMLTPDNVGGPTADEPGRDAPARA